MPLRERERERKIYYFALLMAQNASNETRVLAGGKKVKGLVFGEEWEYGGETSCVFDDSI